VTNSFADSLIDPSTDLLVVENFVYAIRDSGYLSLSTALAELVDNSLEAGAQCINITVSRPSDSGLTEISVADDGRGMSADELRDCLRFGGTTRFNLRDSFGRFGMGLPMASLSQARRVEVVSWQHGNAPKQIVLDIDDLHANSELTCAAPDSAIHGESGCLVTWKHCDRVEYQRLAWADKSVRRELGRMYRHFLQNGTTITINGTPITAVDPLMMSVEINGDHASPPFDTLTYDVATTHGTTSKILVRFSVLPVGSWHSLDNATKKKTGIIGESGVSILRAGREIARGWHLMGGKRKENYDDWWRCEICFDPDLDEQFGITINKQGIRPATELREALEPELESIARMLNARVRKLFEDVKFQEESQVSCRIAASADCDLPVIGKNTQAKGPLRYLITSDSFPDTTMFHSRLKDSTLSITLNADHPAFSALYKPLQAFGDKSADDFRTAMELLILSFARTTALLEQTDGDYDDLVASWSTTYGRMLRRS